MAERRNITKEDVLLRTRLNTEGARYTFAKEPLSLEIRDFNKRGIHFAGLSFGT